MSDERPLLIEHEGKDWSITYDLRSQPSYRLLVLRGRTTPHNTELVLQVIRENLDRTLDEQGRFYPGIYDLSQSGAFSFQSVKAGQMMTQEFGRYASFMVVILNPYHAEVTLLRALLSMLAQRLSKRVALASTMEEALRLLEEHQAAEKGRGSEAK